MGIEGKTIVFTGKISKPRHEFQALVENHGGIAGSDVSRATDYLVVGDKPGSKLVRAAMLGIKIITEEEFLKLLSEIPEGEVPATPEELEELERHIVTPTCMLCGRTYRQWDTLPNYETCPVCESFTPIPLCPHCGNDPIFVEDFNLYKCMLCGTWFRAPHSIHAKEVKHIHYLQTTRKTLLGSYRSCLACGHQSFLPNEEEKILREKYEAAPPLVKEWARRDKELKERFRKEEEDRRNEKEVLKTLRSLIPEELKQLKENLNGI